MVDLIVGGSSCQVLSREISDELNIELAMVESGRFPDGELYLRVDSDVKGRDVAIVQSTSKHQDSNLFELLSLLETIKREGAREVTAVVPYFGYGRQDRSFAPGEAITSRVIAELISKYADKFISLNLHKSTILDFFDIEALEGDVTPAIAEYYSSFGVKDAVIISPDLGASGLAKNLGKHLKCKYDHLEKKRIGPGRVKIMPSNINLKGKNVIIYDDIMDSGGSISEAVKLLHKQGAESILTACIHPVLSNNAITRLFTSGVVDLVGTNTIPSQISFITVSEIISKMLK